MAQIKMKKTHKWTADEDQTLNKNLALRKTAAEIAEILGLEERQITGRINLLREKGKAAAPANSESPREGVTFEDDGNTGSASSLSRRIRTLDELLAAAKVDLSVWEVEKHIVNKWEVGRKDKQVDLQIDHGTMTGSVRDSGKIFVEPLIQIKAWLKKRVVVNQTRDLIKEMLKQFAEQAPKVPAIIRDASLKQGHLLELSIFDLHLGKLCWAPESGENYDAKLAQSVYTESVEQLLQRAKGFPISRIVLPVGNDFFNVDNAAQTTTAGTPQHEDVRYQKSFVAGRKLMVNTILRLREIAPVDVVMVSGNHDTERIFYLGDALEGWLSKTPGVTVNNEPTLRKYYAFGKCLIGFTHGHNEPHKNLPLIMATEKAELWSVAKFREIHLGHFHHKKEIHWQPGVEEYNGVRIRIIPSLCPTDAWHRMKGYGALRAAEAFLWHAEQGNVGTFSFTP